jgi:hypothetical protein
VCVLACFATSIVTPRNALAGPYTKLQVLLPGETPAPGTGTGKSGAPQSQTVGVPFNVTVRACDNSWNLVTTVTNSVNLTSTDGSASLPGAFSLASGTKTVQVTLNAAGSFTVSAKDNSDATIPQATSSSVAAMLLQGFVFSSITQKNQNAGSAVNVTIRAVNPSGQQVGYNGPVSVQEVTSYGVGRVSPASITMVNGSWSGGLTPYRADETSINRGNVNFYAYLDADGSINGTSDPFTVHPGSFKKLLMVVPGQDPAPGEVTGLTGSPASQSAGQSFAVDVYATDNYYNQIGSGDVARITASDASSPVSGALSNGYRRYNFTLNTVGTRTLTVTDQTNGSITGMTSQGIAVIANSAAKFVVDPITSPQTAGASASVTIRATDSSSNTVPGYNGNAIIIPNTGQGSMSPETITFTNGVWTGPMTFKGAGGAVSFTVSDFSAPPHTGSSNNFVVNPGPVAKMFVYFPGMTPQGGTATGYTGTPTDQQAGTTFNMTVRACDQYWNRVTGNNDTVDLTSTDAFANMPAQITLVNGELVVPVKMYRSGYQRVSAHDASNSGVLDYTSTQVLVNGGPYARIVVLCPGESIAPGTANGRTGTATDQST